MGLFHNDDDYFAAAHKKNRRKVHLIITASGWVFILISFMVGLAAIQSNLPMVFVLFGMMLGAIAISALFARLSFTGMKIRRKVPGRVWQNDQLYFEYKLINRNRFLPCIGTKIAEARFHDKTTSSFNCFCVYSPADEISSAGRWVWASRRGKLELDVLTASTVFPFGLTKILRTFSATEQIIIWPAKGKLLVDLLHHGAQKAPTGSPGRKQGGQDEFIGLREYRQGDSMRWIHWRKSATRSAPVVIEKAHPSPEKLFLIFDLPVAVQTDGHENPCEKFLRFGATLIDQALKRGYVVGLAIETEKQVELVAPANGIATRTHLLDLLAEYVPPSENSDKRFIQNHIPTGYLSSSHVVFVTANSNSDSPGKLAGLEKFAGRSTLINPSNIDEYFEDDSTFDFASDEYSETIEKIQA